MSNKKKYPSWISYVETENGFKFKSDGGSSFFKKKYFFYLNIFTYIYIIAISILFFFSIVSSNNIKDFSFFCYLSCIIVFIINTLVTSIKIDIIVTSKGIEIKSKKDSLFIERQNIKDICVDKYLDRDYDYRLILKTKKTLKLPYLDDTNLTEFNLFGNKKLNSKTAYFLLKEFIVVLDLDID
ncbi:hypothetical protein IJJ97_05835 [bacterium]|nr:hypothetical protein [bacterium]